MKSFVQIDEYKAHAKRLVIEPWAEEFSIEDGLIIEIEGQRSISLEDDLYVEGDYLIITAPPGTTCRLCKAGVDLSGGMMSNPAP